MNATNYATVRYELRRPINDSKSRLPHVRFSLHSSRQAWRRRSLSLGSRSSEAIVSISIPRKVRQVVDPSRLCSAIGTPNAAHAAFSVPKSVAHTGECGGPIKMKRPVSVWCRSACGARAASHAGGFNDVCTSLINAGHMSPGRERQKSRHNRSTV